MHTNSPTELLKATVPHATTEHTYLQLYNYLSLIPERDIISQVIRVQNRRFDRSHNEITSKLIMNLWFAFRNDLGDSSQKV